MTVQQIINWEHVECIKITDGTTVYIRFISGESTVSEFKNSEQVNNIVKAFLDWGYDGRPSKVYFIDKELK